MTPSLTGPDPRDASASENFNAEWSFKDFYIFNDYIYLSNSQPQLEAWIITQFVNQNWIHYHLALLVTG